MQLWFLSLVFIWYSKLQAHKTSIVSDISFNTNSLRNKTACYRIALLKFIVRIVLLKCLVKIDWIVRVALLKLVATTIIYVHHLRIEQANLYVSKRLKIITIEISTCVKSIRLSSVQMVVPLGIMGEILGARMKPLENHGNIVSRGLRGLCHSEITAILYRGV